MVEMFGNAFEEGNVSGRKKKGKGNTRVKLDLLLVTLPISHKPNPNSIPSEKKSITSTEIPAAKEEAIVIEYAVEEQQDEPLLKEN
ncbi:hypothetical protein RUND412_011420 [Rhizina undulata]